MLKKLLLPGVLILAACAGGNFEKSNAQFVTGFSDGTFEKSADAIAAATISNQKPNNPYLGGLQCGSGYMWAEISEGRKVCFDAVNMVLMGEADEGTSYKIKNYETIMFKTYEGAGLLADGDPSARQAFLQAYDLQSQNIQEMGAEIEELREKFAEDQQKLRDAGQDVPDMNSIVAAVDAEMASAPDSVAPMKDYANPYTTYLIALYDGANGDMNNAKNFLKRVAQFAPENTFVKTDADALASKKGSVWIILENGMVGPVKKRALAPQLLQSLNIRVTIPDMFPGTPAVRSVSAAAGDQRVETEFLANMDAIVKTDLDKYKSGNIVKSVAFEVGKVAAATIAGIAAKKAADKSPWADLAAMAAVMAIMSVEKPWDLRSWDSLPNEIQTARLDMPADRKVIIGNDLEVMIPDDIKNAIVFVRIPTVKSNIGIMVGKLN